MFGIVVALLLVAAAVLRPSVADPSVTGLVWAGLLGALVLGIAWPIVAVRTLGLRVVSAPTDLVVGELATIEIELAGRVSGLSIGATGSETVIVDVVSPGIVRIPATISARGSYSRLSIDVASDAPFGIAWAQRARLVDLPRPMLVAPPSIPAAATPRELAGVMQEPLPQGQGTSGESVRAVRPYVSGDPAHLVHWPTSARLGSLVVREMEPPATRALAVVVDLSRRTDGLDRNARAGGTDGADLADGEDRSGNGTVADPVEIAAARSLGLIESALGQGARVVLCTAEPTGPVAAEVPDLLGARRRLALAVEGPPAAPPEDWPVLHLVAEQGAAT